MSERDTETIRAALDSMHDASNRNVRAEHAEALAALDRLVGRLQAAEQERDAWKKSRDEWWRIAEDYRAELVAAEARVVALETALRDVEPLVAACEDLYAGPTMDSHSDEEDVMARPSGITFGMIRRARAALSVSPAPSEQAPKVSTKYGNDGYRRDWPR